MNPNSLAANDRIDPHKATDCQRIRDLVEAAGPAGLTRKEMKLEHPTAQPPRFKYPNEFSGRPKELKEDGLLFDSKRKRDGCTVWVARPEWVTP
jgi:hypothetical protein